MTGADKHNMASGSGALRGHKRLRAAGFTPADAPDTDKAGDKPPPYGSEG